ncbi:hypothetical protein GCM10009543_39760 [Leifsonia naganoensis]
MNATVDPNFAYRDTPGMQREGTLAAIRTFPYESETFRGTPISPATPATGGRAARGPGIAE